MASTVETTTTTTKPRKSTNESQISWKSFQTSVYKRKLHLIFQDIWGAAHSVHNGEQ